MKRLLTLSALLLSFAMYTPAHATAQASGAYGQPQTWHGVLSATDQSQFDKYYAKWVDATRKNDQEDISENARKMQEIMARYNIPSTVSYDQVASMGGAAGYPAQAYPNTAYPAASAQRLSPDDQKDFDKAYSKWVDSTRKNDQDDVNESARKMQEIMARYNIPSTVPFAQVASGGTAGVYPNPAYAYPTAQGQRLSSSDQHEFDEAYKKWLKARHKKDPDDIDKSARRMQDIMARYNIPANVPYDQIASPGAGYK
jgi:hypothetical protein